MQNAYDDADRRSWIPQEEDGDDFFNGSPSARPDTMLYSTPPTRPANGPPGPSSTPPPILDHSHLRPGNQAALLSHERTLELYRANAKKTQDPDLQFEFAVFMIDASKTLPIPVETPGNVM